MNANYISTNTTSLSAHQRRLSSVIYNLEAIIQKNPHETVEAQTIMFLLEVAGNETPVDLTYIGTKLGLSKAAASRNFYRLADGRTGDTGLDLVKAVVDYKNRRRVSVELTPKGISLVQELTTYLEKRVINLKEH